MSFDSVMSRISAIETKIASFSSVGNASGVAETNVVDQSTSVNDLDQNMTIAQALEAFAKAQSTNSASDTSTTQFIEQLSALTGVSIPIQEGEYDANYVSQTVPAENFLEEAKKYQGVPYVWGGNTSAGLDCSGLVKLALSNLGINDFPRVARDQMKEGTEVSSLDQAVAGDLVVFENGKHIGIYIGDGKMIDAPKPGDKVRIRDVYETPTTIRRILP